jgi:hypothetical protein
MMPPRVAVEYAAAQRQLAFEDAEYLIKAAGSIRFNLNSGNYDAASKVAKAWASFALALSARLDGATSYEKGAIDAVANHEHVEIDTAKASTPFIHGNIVTSRSRSKGKTARTYDCGTLGVLTMSQMTGIAKMSSTAIYQRLLSGMTPEEACTKPRQLGGRKSKKIYQD